MTTRLPLHYKLTCSSLVALDVHSGVLESRCARDGDKDVAPGSTQVVKFVITAASFGLHQETITVINRHDLQCFTILIRLFVDDGRLRVSSPLDPQNKNPFEEMLEQAGEQLHAESVCG